MGADPGAVRRPRRGHERDRTPPAQGSRRADAGRGWVRRQGGVPGAAAGAGRAPGPATGASGARQDGGVRLRTSRPRRALRHRAWRQAGRHARRPARPLHVRQRRIRRLARGPHRKFPWWHVPDPELRARGLRGRHQQDARRRVPRARGDTGLFRARGGDGRAGREARPRSDRPSAPERFARGRSRRRRLALAADRVGRGAGGGKENPGLRRARGAGRPTRACCPPRARRSESPSERGAVPARRRRRAAASTPTARSR